MNGPELIKHQLDAAGNQVEKAFAGLSGDQWNHQATKDTMSPVGIAEHLAECYEACLKHLRGEQHEWGSYSIDDKSPENVMATMRAKRQEAASQLIAKGDEDALKTASDYMVLHDAYHVGQLAAIRMDIGGWNPYSLYE